MNKRTKIILSFLMLLLYVAIANLYANTEVATTATNASEETNAIVHRDILANTSSDIARLSYNVNSGKQLPFQLIESEEIESELPSPKDDFVSIKSFLHTINEAQLLNDLVFQKQKEYLSNRACCITPSIKLHVIFQVFTI